MLIDGLVSEGVTGASVLDIGGGIGAVHHELLAAGAQSATHVDVSADYLRVAEEVSKQRGTTGRVRQVHGDFVEHAATLGNSDIAVLDRVICCYPDMELLVERSAAKTNRLYGAVYPRGRRLMQWAFAAQNAINKIRHVAFRIYLHSPDAIAAVLRRQGFQPVRIRRTLLWEVAIYRRGPSVS